MRSRELILHNIAKRHLQSQYFLDILAKMLKKIAAKLKPDSDDHFVFCHSVSPLSTSDGECTRLVVAVCHLQVTVINM